MTINTYDLEQLVRVTGLFEASDGTDVDPATVTLEVLSPSGVGTTYVYGGSPDTVDKDSVGNYHVDLTANEVGWWFYKWTTTGTGAGAQEGEFLVKPAHF